MNRVEQNGSATTAVSEESVAHVASVTSPITTKQPFVPAKQKPKFCLRDAGRLQFIGAGIVVVLLLLVFSGVSKKSIPARRLGGADRTQQQVDSQSSTGPSITPILDSNRAAAQETDHNLVNPAQIAGTASKQTRQHVPSDLGGMPPFENPPSWQPPPYRPGSQSVAIDENAGTAEAINARSERDATDKTSLVFVRNNQFKVDANPESTNPPIAWDLGLAPGTRLRARLESTVSTAVPTPVVAVIEYNYEQSGEIVIPAGAKVFGHLESADRSGYAGIRFDSLMMPDGASNNIEATATDLQLGPLRGKLEGKHTGKNIVVRSLAGVGEIAATLAGRGSLNQPLSESDLLRERISNNIGQASDQTVANLAITERIVVSIPAGTEIYVVLQKQTKRILHNILKKTPDGDPSIQGIDELRQLMQLQREFKRQCWR